MKFANTTLTVAVALSVAAVSNATYQPRCYDPIQDTDFAGDDFKVKFGLPISDCYNACIKNDNCVSFTYYNSNCYLKQGRGGNQQYKQGAISVRCDHPKPPTPAPTGQPSGPCATPMYGNCGSDSGITCCPGGQYCQPWNPGFYQCMPVPSKCAKQLTNVDFAGNDLKAVYGLQPSACCDECAKTAGCKAFTFVNSNPGSPACYLKSGEGEHRPMVGAVSGVVN